jgi:hypothetical protein
MRSRETADVKVLGLVAVASAALTGYSLRRLWKTGQIR